MSQKRNYMIRFSFLLIALTLFLSLPAFALQENQGIAWCNNDEILINGQRIYFQDENGNRIYPVNYDGNVYIPIASAAEWLGCTFVCDLNASAVFLSQNIEPEFCTVLGTGVRTDRDGVAVSKGDHISIFLDETSLQFEDISGNVVYPILISKDVYVPLSGIAKLCNMDMLQANTGARQTVYLWSPFTTNQQSEIETYIACEIKLRGQLKNCIDALREINDNNTDAQLLTCLEEISFVLSQFAQNTKPDVLFTDYYIDQITEETVRFNTYINERMEELRNNSVSIESFFKTYSMNTDLAISFHRIERNCWNLETMYSLITGRDAVLDNSFILQQEYMK